MQFDERDGVVTEARIVSLSQRRSLMDVLKVTGGRPLAGEVRIDGAKNAALPMMAATLAVTGPVELNRIPQLVDVQTMSLLLKSLGTDVTQTSQGCLKIVSRPSDRITADWELMRRMRAGICVLGPLLARCGKAVVSLPGGCNIGHRPVDLHLKGLAALGADVRVERGYIIAECSSLSGADIDLSGPSGATVTGTCNVMVAASLAKGQTIIRGAAQEPEVRDLANFLNACGANISGQGTDAIEVVGVRELNGQPYDIISDRIEAATFAIAAAATRGRICLRDVPIDDMQSVLKTLQTIGVGISTANESGTTRQRATLHVDGSGSLSPTDIVATPYPGIPTDTQAQFMALLTTVDGESRVQDFVFPDRFLHASELMRMGADIQRRGSEMRISGGQKLSAAHVMASDLRASAALVIAALAASGTSSIHRIYHLDRGYSNLDEKLRLLQAEVRRERE